MKLSKLLEIHSINDIKGLAMDSRDVKPGYLFFAYQGAHCDGRLYIQDAITQGAFAVLVDGEVPNLETIIPIISVENLKEKIPAFAADYYHHPADSLRLLGITGTNGKTSCSHFIATLLHQLQYPCGIVGTLGNGLYGNLKTTTLTTPDPITLHQTLAAVLSEGAKAVAMEVSSHSLDQGRVDGLDFEVGIFTNLTRDHLDYHGSMDAYGAAKRKLFNQARSAVINADDAFGRTLIETLSNDSIYTYSMDVPLNKSTYAVYTQNVKLDIAGIHATLISPWGEGEMSVPLIGKFNLSNVLAAVTTLCVMKIPFNQILQCVSTLAPVPGRMQTLGGGQQPLVVVDYAHTPDALEKVLAALREHCQGKLYCLFGCGGDRDRGKRPMMASIAEQYADGVVVTDDNPRTEEPSRIVEEILQGFADSAKAIVEHNRSKAIKDIIQYAKPGDCVLIAGKGAESYQLIGNEKIPFSDVEQVKESL